MRTRLTNRRLEALGFAMSHMLAGDVEATLESADGVTEDDLHAAEDWIYEELLRRSEKRLDVPNDRRKQLTARNTSE